VDKTDEQTRCAVLDVPQINQRDYSGKYTRGDIAKGGWSGNQVCSAASLTAVLKYYGKDVTLNSVTDQMIRENKLGYWVDGVYMHSQGDIRNLISYTETHYSDLTGTWEGFSMNDGKTGLDRIEENIEAEQPVIVDTDLGAGHYLVVKGIRYENGKRMVILEDPYFNKEEYTEEEFLEIWYNRDAGNRRILVISRR
jgi:uncharacterized protein YvpB